MALEASSSSSSAPAAVPNLPSDVSSALLSEPEQVVVVNEQTDENDINLNTSAVVISEEEEVPPAIEQDQSESAPEDNTTQKLQQSPFLDAFEKEITYIVADYREELRDLVQRLKQTLLEDSIIHMEEMKVPHDDVMQQMGEGMKSNTAVEIKEKSFWEREQLKQANSNDQSQTKASVDILMEQPETTTDTGNDSVSDMRDKQQGTFVNNGEDDFIQAAQAFKDEPQKKGRSTPRQSELDMVQESKEEPRSTVTTRSRHLDQRSRQTRRRRPNGLQDRRRTSERMSRAAQVGRRANGRRPSRGAWGSNAETTSDANVPQRYQSRTLRDVQARRRASGRSGHNRNLWGAAQDAANEEPPRPIRLPKSKLNKVPRRNLWGANPDTVDEDVPQRNRQSRHLNGGRRNTNASRKPNLWRAGVGISDEAQRRQQPRREPRRGEASYKANKRPRNEMWDAEQDVFDDLSQQRPQTTRNSNDVLHENERTKRDAPAQVDIEDSGAHPTKQQGVSSDQDNNQDDATADDTSSSDYRNASRRQRSNTKTDSERVIDDTQHQKSLSTTDATVEKDTPIMSDLRKLNDLWGNARDIMQAPPKSLRKKTDSEDDVAQDDRHGEFDRSSAAFLTTVNRHTSGRRRRRKSNRLFRRSRKVESIVALWAVELPGKNDPVDSVSTDTESHLDDETT